MPLFRKQRGSLEESLKTTVIVKTNQELKDAILEDWDMWLDVEREDGTKLNSDIGLIIKPYLGDCDYRCGWYTQIVSANLMSENEFCVVGYLSEPM